MAANFRLNRGDNVALIAPASGQKAGQGDLVTQAIACLTTWGLNVVITPTFSAEARYLSADDATRGHHLIKALTQPDIKAIFVTRGGYGCARLLPQLTAITVPTPRYLIGFSDITTLHLHFADTPNVYSVHAPNMATAQILGDDPHATANREALYQLLFQQTTLPLALKPLFSQQHSKLPVISADTPRVGGCLSLLVTSLGTPHEVDSDDNILMIEEVGESPYKIDRMLTHLQNAGKFDHVKGVVFGDMVGCQTATIDVAEVLSDFFSAADFPVFLTNDFGHGAINLPWHYGDKAIAFTIEEVGKCTLKP